jgi:hypothetical protein
MRPEGLGNLIKIKLPNPSGRKTYTKNQCKYFGYMDNALFSVTMIKDIH